MGKGRIEAFSDGVIAIIITIMVLELKAPHDSNFSSLLDLTPAFLSYLLSFIYIGIYWNNHHHLIHAVHQASAGIMWANLHLLFWLSMVPFVTAWMGENHFTAVPTAIYGVVLLLAAVSYFILQIVIVSKHGKGSTLAVSIGRDTKGKLSIALYATSIPLALLIPWAACIVYVLVAVMWLIPDRRIESALTR